MVGNNTPRQIGEPKPSPSSMPPPSSTALRRECKPEDRNCSGEEQREDEDKTSLVDSYCTWKRRSRREYCFRTSFGECKNGSVDTGGIYTAVRVKASGALLASIADRTTRASEYFIVTGTHVS